MGLRLGAGVALVAVGLLGFTVATPQDATLGVSVDIKDVFDPRGVNKAGLEDVDLDDDELGKLLDRIDGAGLDPDLIDNLDPAALAALLDGMTPEELATLGLTPEEAQAMIDRLRDPDLSPEELADIAAELSDRGLRFANDDADGRFDAGEAAYADLDGDGQVSEGDIRLGVLALLYGVDRGLGDKPRQLLTAYEFAGGLGIDRPLSAESRDSATAATSPLAASGYPTDRALGPGGVVCVQLYTPSLTCHTRTFVHGQILDKGDHYLFALADGGTRTLLDPDPTAPGPRARGHLLLELQGQIWVPVPALTPADVLVSTDRTDLDLARDGNGMVWARGDTGVQHVNLTWAVDLSYYDLPVAADVTAADVPEAERPVLDAVSYAVGTHIADLAGAHGRAYGDAVRAVAAFTRDFGLGALPDRDEQSDDLLAVAEAQVGCARHRAEAFTLAVQALGMPARLIVNEGHVFTEVFVPKAGWHLVDLGACGRVQVHALEGHDEVMALQDLPYTAEDAPPSQADLGSAPATAYINITELPPSLRRNEDFDIAGLVESPDGDVPEGIPITFTYNRTKEQPGTPFCSTQTERGGEYRGTCRLGAGTPAGSLQLVARLAPSVISGSPSAEAYSDPPFVVQKATTLTLVGHAKTSADVPVTYTAHVVDEDGAPVPQRVVSLRVDGGTAITRATDASGRARFPLELDAGEHTLSAALGGDDTYDPSEDTFTLEATTTRIGLKVDAAKLEKGSLVVEGGVIDGTDLKSGAGRSLSARWANDPDGAEQTKTLKTGADGRFIVAFDGQPRPGPGLVSIIDSKTGVGVDIAFARSVDASATLTVPPRWALGTAVPVEVRIQGPDDPVPLRVTLDGLAVADIEAGDQLPANVLLTVPAGVHEVALEAGQGVRLTATTATILVSPVEATLGQVPIQSPGSTLTVTGTLRFDGQGLAGPVSVRLLGAEGRATSASDGTFSVSLVVPADATPGNATAVLTLPDIGHQIEVALRIQRPANLALEAPGVSFQAFGKTRITVRGEGNVTVFADGKPLGPIASGGRIEVPTQTLFWRRIDLRAEAVPTGADLSPSTMQATVYVFNPAMIAGVPALAIVLAVATFKGVGWWRRRQAFRNRFLPLPPRSRIRVVEPDLPRRVPRVFDPEVDPALVLRLPRAGAWTVLDGKGRLVPAQVTGRDVRIPLDRLPRGAHKLRFRLEKKELSFDVSVQDLRSALDEATLGLLERIGKTSPWPATLQAMEDGLRSAGAADPDAVAVRTEAESSLYTVDRFGRDRFHAFFAALDAAQARRTA